MAILSSDDYPAIRASIAVDLDEEDIPDATIALPQYAPRAELLLLQRDPLAATRTDPTEAKHVKLAAIFFAASLLAPAIPAITAFKGDDASYQRTVDWNARAMELRSLADSEITAVLDPDAIDDNDRPFGFGLAHSGRSWQPWAFGR